MWKLILISAGPFESEYEQEVMQIRLGRLSQIERDEAKQILTEIEAGHQDPSSFRRFGKLMARVDSYERIFLNFEKKGNGSDHYKS